MTYFLTAHVLSAAGVILSVMGYLRCTHPSSSR
jgi:hypothetical protein